jgi:mannose-6-phosphate isomerase-like protein (cupin superfamily)
VDDKVHLPGRLIVQPRDREVELGPGEMFVVPAGVEHRPVAPEETIIMCIEPEGTAPTED